MSTVEQIKKHASEVYRIVEIKRRDAVTGLFEDNWLDISEDVVKWGKLKNSIDPTRINKLVLGGVKITFENNKGLYNPNDDDNSLWFGYGDQQRTLVRVRAGFERWSKTNGIWAGQRTPYTDLWDDDYSSWDEAFWDSDGGTIFTGIIWGDIILKDNAQVTITVKPLTQVFRDYAAQNITGYNNSITASGFIELVRDHQDGSGNYIFRPFFGNTTTGFNYNTTTSIYPALSTSGAKDVIDSTVWQVIEKLAEAENYIAYSNSDGIFQFVSRDGATSSSYQVHGVGSFSSVYGNTIKKVNSFGKKISKYYSRVQLKYIDADTITSYSSQEATLEVTGANAAWNLGQRTLSFSNFWITDTATADALVSNIFNNLSSLKDEMNVTCSFLPQLEILDRLEVYYDASGIYADSTWDQNNWAEDVGDAEVDNPLIFDRSVGQAIRLNGDEFNILEYEIDLDKLETRLTLRGV